MDSMFRCAFLINLAEDKVRNLVWGHRWCRVLGGKNRPRDSGST